MTGDQSTDRTEVDISRAVAEAFGRAPAQPTVDATQAFREAGFSEDLAERGTRMLESGKYLGFTDAATSLAAFHSSPLVTRANIEEAAGRYERLSKAVQEDGVTFVDGVKQ